MNKTADMTAYQREYYRRKYKDNPDFAEKRRQYRLNNYDRIREQEKKSRELHRDAHREKSRERMKEYRQSKRYKELKPDQDIKRKYGITREEWDALFLEQGSACGICRTTSNNGRRWHTDHCHTTNKVRGILCNHCNLMLGHARDNVNSLRNAITYLTNHYDKLPTE